MTEWLHFHFSLLCIGEENGNSLQCSCLENPRDGGAWWAAVHGVAQSRARLKWLSSSNPHTTLKRSYLMPIFQMRRLKPGWLSNLLKVTLPVLGSLTDPGLFSSIVIPPTVLATKHYTCTMSYNCARSFMYVWFNPHNHLARWEDWLHFSAKETEG